MAIFRNLTFQRVLSLIFLCTALLSQTQILYACELMDGKPKLVCCCGESMSDGCPMSESCAMHANTDEGHCCEVSQDSLTDDVVMTHSSSMVDFLTLLLDGPQPPPVIDYQELLSASLQATLGLAIPPYEPLLLGSGKQTYLLTRRLRL
ncbi:hypothetical protein [Methylobacter sp. BBA5.1]|jgi:hypothetical protein|uniref:hypothetical protein n=1 Tax=Methylobacter sp. BBA5.1 TaxID=1495064 RepID=UPI0012694BEC|nr:hypothetical protein [Methylobacter sp. BBA5.1]